MAENWEEKSNMDGDRKKRRISWYERQERKIEKEKRK